MSEYILSLFLSMNIDQDQHHLENKKAPEKGRNCPCTLVREIGAKSFATLPPRCIYPPTTFCPAHNPFLPFLPLSPLCKSCIVPAIYTIKQRNYNQTPIICLRVGKLKLHNTISYIRKSTTVGGLDFSYQKDEVNKP